MNINLKFLLLGTSLSLIPTLTYAQCTTTPDCAAMGYKETTNKGGCLKCPTGNGWYCPQPKEEKAVLGECTGYAKNCSIGQILNSDGTCSSDKVSGKTPLGIVVAIKDNCGYAMTENPIERYIKWSTEEVNTGAFQSSNWQDAIKDFDVSGNMTKIIQSGNSTTYPAAYAAMNYAPSAALTSKGKWMLPTAGILNSLYTNLNAINNTISKLGGTQLKGEDEHIWSSSEYSRYGVWVLSLSTSTYGGGVYAGSKYSSSNVSDVVRPVLAF